MLVILLIIFLLALFLINVPVAFSIGLATIFITLLSPSLNIDLLRLPQAMFNQLNSFPLVALPFFILAGKLMEHGGISKKLVNLAVAIVGHLRGGLGMVTILSCMFFAAISGSAIATTVAIGAIMIPAMVARGYDRNFSSTLAGVGGTIGVLIPPSVPMVIYGIIASASVGQLFFAGIIPGVMVGLSLMVLCYFYGRKRNIEKFEDKKSAREVWDTLKDAIWALLMPVIILGGIYSGIFTPTESAAIAVVYGFIIGIFVYKLITRSVLMEILRSTVYTTSAIGLILASASFFGIYLTLARIPQTLAEVLQNSALTPFFTIMLVNIFLLILGTFMEAAAAMIIAVPILLPVVTAAGIDPVHFGIIVIINLGIGTLTPPLGVLLFVAAKVGETKYERLLKPAIPFILILIANLIVITLLPQLTSGFASLFR